MTALLALRWLRGSARRVLDIRNLSVEVLSRVANVLASLFVVSPKTMRIRLERTGIWPQAESTWVDI
jgi:hypothetical protein